ncbi:hypothetical protein ACIF85_08685 [Streptomyces sp. NPDC086033]|uniref:hypothetical protein n=1 Tax=Streptomyces sp. NPDC086033 TaxID=3365747 RepID=UPI0037D1C341
MYACNRTPTAVIVDWQSLRSADTSAPTGQARPREEGAGLQRALPERQQWTEVVGDPVCGRLAR